MLVFGVLVALLRVLLLFLLLVLQLVVPLSSWLCHTAPQHHETGRDAAPDQRHPIELDGERALKRLALRQEAAPARELLKVVACLREHLLDGHGHPLPGLLAPEHRPPPTLTYLATHSERVWVEDEETDLADLKQSSDSTMRISTYLLTIKDNATLASLAGLAGLRVTG
jgi:hypothetical protein